MVIQKTDSDKIYLLIIYIMSKFRNWYLFFFLFDFLKILLLIASIRSNKNYVEKFQIHTNYFCDNKIFR
jgi:hypothetical protein